MAKWDVKIGLFEKPIGELMFDDNATPKIVADTLINLGYLDPAEIGTNIMLSPGKNSGVVTLVDDSGYPYATLTKVKTSSETLGQVAAQATTIANSGPKCPTCGSTHIEKIGVMGRTIDGWFFGRLSPEGRAQFWCKSCDYRW